MPRCLCITKSTGTQCKNKATTDPNLDHRFCKQHQGCVRQYALQVGQNRSQRTQRPDRPDRPGYNPYVFNPPYYYPRSNN